MIVGADPCGFELEQAVKQALSAAGHEVCDATPEAAPFAEAARRVAEGVQSGDCARGVVLCGTGMGVSIVANKHRGVYAALCESWYQARRARVVNNCNVLCMGGMLIGKALGCAMAEVFVETEYLQGCEGDEWRALAQDYQSLTRAEREVFACQAPDGRDPQKDEEGF